MSNIETIKTFATFKKTLYRNDYNGYCVFQVVAGKEQELKAQTKHLTGHFNCVGTIPEYRQDTPLYLEGIVEQSQYGYQLKVTKIEPRSWSTMGLTTYLCNICPGVGMATANALAERFGDSIFQVVMRENGAATLAGAVYSLSYENAVLLRDTIATSQVQKNVYDAIAPYGGSWSAALKISQKYGVSAVKELQENPYQTGMKQGLDFETCDKIAHANGLQATDANRIRHALIAACTAEQSGGHVFSYEADILKRVKKILRKGAYGADGGFPSAMILDALEKDDTFVMEFDDEGNEGVYLKWMHRAENEVARHIMRLLQASEPLNYDPSVVDWAESTCGIKYAPQQRAAFRLIQKTGVAIVTGGPGTGKTTTVNGLISAYEKLNPGKIVRMCAPTGRAAQRMTESTGKEAVTIHRLLEFRPYGNDVAHKNAADPIEADLIVVDEASMLDIELAEVFLSAIKSGTLVLFIGDINQLPSVGPGDVLNDMIASKVVPTVQLTAVFRQGSQSSIVLNSRSINDGLHGAVTDENYNIEVYSSTDAMRVRIGLLAKSRYNPQKPFDFQILAPTHKGDVGVANINQSLQELLNPPSPNKAELTFGSRVYRVGDKIIMLNNNYSAGYFNGDIGTVQAVTSEGVVVKIMEKELTLTRTEMEDMNLAYCISIHKSQGSEFQDTVVVLPEKPSNMLKRNLLYTAITRAKKKVWVITESFAYLEAIENCETGKRNTRLASKLRSLSM